MSVYDYRDRPAYRNEDWPPYSNRNISKWWTAEHDKLLGRLIDQWQWHWYWEVADAVVSITPKDAIASFCRWLANWHETESLRCGHSRCALVSKDSLQLLVYITRALQSLESGAKFMSTDIGSMIVSSPAIRHGRPCIAGTGITVHRIAIWYKLGHSPEEIARRYGHLTEAQIHAALAYYLANREEVEAEIAADEAEAVHLEDESTQEQSSAS